MLNTHAIRNRFGRWTATRLAARRAGRPGAPLERLEERRLMAATTPIITEFLASNDSGIRDQDGQRSDWIELYNPTAADVSLGGYFLTDDAADLDKWRLPDVTLPSNGYLIVWASGKNRAVAGSELHTNFNLDAAVGEYLALVAPDGVTPVSAFSPAFPAQGTDVSYGVSVSQDVTSLIGPRNTARTRIPTSTDNLTAWRAWDFPDTSWTSGTTGVGYETDSPPPPTPGFRTRLVDVREGTRTDINTINDAVSILDSADGTAGGAYVVESDTTVVKTVINMASGGAFGGDQPLPGQTTANSSLELYALRANADVFIPAGNWTINVNSDDGFRLRIPGVTFLNVTNGQLASSDAFEFPTPRGPDNTFATFTVPTGGLNTRLQLDFYENRVGDSIELSVAQGHRASFSTSTFTLLGNTVLGWNVWDPNTFNPGSYRPLIGTDVRTAMYDVNASAFVRVPFGVANANDYDTLRLQMKYDDGFVAYLNGVEVARRNAPASLPYNAQATASRPDEQAIVYESISIPATSLRNGTNVLAIHALNAAANSTDMLVYPELQGFRTTVGTDARFFAQPTPGAANSTPASEGVVADTKFSVDRGFFDAPFQLAITTATPGATIRYTTDGTTPTATSGLVYSGPITVSRTTTLRAAAFRANYVPSNVDTQTYLFLDDVIRQSTTTAPAPNWPAPGTRVNGQVIDYGMTPSVVDPNPAAVKDALKSIPTFSIVMKAEDLFNPQTGIYVNPSGDGRPWERPGSVELIYPDGTKKGFQIDAGIRLRGGFSRSGDNPKHAFRLFFRNEYDGDLKFPMFGPGGSDSYDSFDLRTFQNYSWSFGGDPSGIFMRDQLNRDLQLAMGQDGERGDYYHLYINGQYWGLYNSAERPEANHGADYFGGDPDDYDVIKVDPDLGHNIEATDGNMDAWNQLYTLLRGNNLAPVTEDVLQRVQGNNPDGTRNPAYPVLLDVGNLIDYMLVIYWGGNKDAPISDFIGNDRPNNFYALRNRNGDEGFRFYVHDAEHTMLPWEPNRNRLGPTPGTGWNAGNQGVGVSNPQWFFQRLWHLPSFKTQVADRVQRHMVNPNGTLTANRVSAQLQRRSAEIDRAVIAESARWGDSKRPGSPLTRFDWLNAVGQVQNWVSGRTATVIQQLRDWGLYPWLDAPRFGQNGGQVPVGYQLNIAVPGAPAGTSIYYTLDGSDPRAGNGTPRGILYTGPVTINDTTRVRARALSGATWSALNEALFTIDLAAIRITELMYHPAAPAGGTVDKEEFEFVEVMNTGPTERNLTGVRIEGGIEFSFPDNFRLAPGARTVVVKNLAAFQSRYGAGVNVAGVYSGTLNNAGEELRLVSGSNAIALRFTYDDDWHPQTDGEGFSLNIINPAGPAANWGVKSGWAASNRIHGTPGAPDDGPAPGSVIVNEVVSTPEAGDAGGDFIELRNTTNSPVDLSGWFLSDSAANLRKFQIPAGTTIAANGYLVFRQAQLGFDIPSTPGEVFVSSGDGSGNLGGYRESSRFGVGEAGFSFGQHVKSTGGTDFVALTAPTPGLANAAPRVGPVVINEIMYHPTAGRAEYIELYNLTGSDVVLHDAASGAAWKFVDGIDYTFPAGAYVPAFGYALVVAVDPAVFRSQYDVPPGVPIFGPYQLPDGTNVLADGGENLTLYRPTPLGVDALADRVNYTAAAPWPAEASNTDQPIARVDSRRYGNDPAAWDMDTLRGTPGRVNIDIDWPAADIIDVSPDPRTTPVDAVTIVFSEPVRGFDPSDLRLTRDGGPNLLNGAQTLTSADNITWTLSGLAGLTGAAGTYSISIATFGANVVDWAGNLFSGQVSDTWRVGGAPAGRVVGRHVFYNGSAYDGLSLASGTADDAAIASNKQALLPGETARFANYTSYTRGINGVMVDVAGLLADLTAADFTFKVGNDADLGAWQDAPAPLAVTRRAGAGVNGSDRLTITWADGAVRNTWLRVTVLANGRTGLPSADVFYFGNLVGEVGDSTTSAIVTAADVMVVRSAQAASVPAVHVADFNRDGRINAIDLAVARAAAGGSSLTLLTAPMPVAATAAVATTATVAGTTPATTAATAGATATSSTTATSAGTTTAGATAAPAPAPVAAPVTAPATRTQPARRAPATPATPFSQTAIPAAASDVEPRRRDSLVVAADDVLGSGR